MLRFMASAAILVLLTVQANARSTPNRGDMTVEFDRHAINQSVFPDVRPSREPAGARCSHHGCREARASRKRIQEGSTVVERPSVCPTRAYCGCASSVKVFGHPVRELYLAANWLRFPRTEPAPGMIAARHGHVFVIQEVLGNNTVLAWDPNSGGHQTRVHVRSLAGFSVRNPHGSRVAGL